VAARNLIPGVMPPLRLGKESQSQYPGNVRIVPEA